MELNVHARGGAGGSVQVSDAVFGAEFKQALVHQVVTNQLNLTRHTRIHNCSRYGCGRGTIDNINALRNITPLQQISDEMIRNV